MSISVVFFDIHTEHWILRKFGVFRDYSRCFGARRFDHLYIFNCLHTEVGDSPLFSARKLSRTAKREVELGEVMRSIDSYWTLSEMPG